MKDLLKDLQARYRQLDDARKHAIHSRDLDWEERLCNQLCGLRMAIAITEHHAAKEKTIWEKR